MQELAQNGWKSQHDNFQGAMATLDGLGCQTVDGLGGTGARSNYLGFHIFYIGIYTEISVNRYLTV